MDTQAKLNELIGAQFDSVEEARAACEFIKANTTSEVVRKRLIVDYGSAPGKFRCVTNGDIAESL